MAGRGRKASSYTSGRLFRSVNIGICLLVTGLVFAAFQFKALDKVELISLDKRYKLRGMRKGDPRIVLIDIDEASIGRIGRWPWSREWHASLITALTKYSPGITAFDIFFSEPMPLIDFFLVESTRLAKNVVYALAFEFAKEERKIPEAQDKALSRFIIDKSQITGNRADILEVANPIPPLSGLYSAAMDAGHVITIPDADGTIRRAPAVIRCRGKYYLQFALTAILDYLGIDRHKIKIILGKYIYMGNGTKIPIDKKGFMIINWAAPWGKGFAHYSFWEVVASYQRILNGEKPIIPLNKFTGKLCFIGLTATGLIDIKPIPLSPAYPIVGMHANIADTILRKKFIYKVKPPLNLLIIMLLTLPVGIILPHFRPIGGILFFLGTAFLYTAVTFFLFSAAGVWLNLIYPLTGISAAFTAVMVHSEVANAVERARLFHLAAEDGLTKLYVVRHFKDILEQEMMKAKRYKRPLSVIMSDIDHFKNVNDTYGHLSGDFILRETANIFKSSCRETDTAGRYGGEEFIIALPETNKQGAVEFAERLRKQIEEITLEYNNIKFNITVSFGVAEFSDDASPADLIKRADEALYVAKETGRNKVCFA